MQAPGVSCRDVSPVRSRLPFLTLEPSLRFPAHPTLARHSPPEVVANFKRCVPPRLPKTKRGETEPAPGPAYPAQSSQWIGPAPLPASSVPQIPPPVNGNPHPQGLSSRVNYSPLNQNGAPTAGWDSAYVFSSVSGPGGMRDTALRPLTVPSDPLMNRYKLDTAIQDVNLARDTCDVLPARVAFDSVGTLLTMMEVLPLLFRDDELQFTLIQGFTITTQDYVELGIYCADVCKALDRGLDGRRLDDLSPSALGAIQQLTT